MKIFLSDLQNSFFRYLRNSVPIGVGYVHAYLDQVFGNDVEIYTFRKFEEMYEKMKTVRPDVAAFGSYAWNSSLTIKTAKYLRDKYPDIVLGIGGPDVSQVVDRSKRDLEENRFIDFYMPNEGEGPMRNLIQACLEAESVNKIPGSAIEGCFTLVRNSKEGEIIGSAMARFDDDINKIPSPYLKGYLDRFLNDRDYLPIIQTSRGCPYRCTFCVSGKTTWTKVKTFDMERIKEEFEYIEKRAANRYLRLADENFGIMHRDVEIAEYIMSRRVDTGFPNAVSIYTDKHPTERVRQINTIMSDCLPFCISFQSVDQDVLKNIKRVNLKEKEITGAIDYARENNLLLATELIFPLPCETFESFLKGIDKLLEYRFESISISQLTILRGSEMDLPEDRNKYGYVTKFHVSDNGYTKHSDMENVEIDEWVVSTNTMSEEETYRIYKVVFIIDFGHFRAIIKELIFLAECHGIRTSKYLLRCAEDHDICPILAEYAQKCSDEVRNSFFDNRDDVVDYVKDVLDKDPKGIRGIFQVRDHLTVDLLLKGLQTSAVDEAANMLEALYAETHGELTDEFREEVLAVKEVTRKSFIPVNKTVPEDVKITTPFDLIAWRQDNYCAPLSEYRKDAPVTVIMRIPNMPLYESIWSDDKDNPRDKYLKNYVSINSANRRRVMVDASVQGLADEAILGTAEAS